MRKLVIVVLGETQEVARDFALEMDHHISELVAKACEDLQEPTMAQCMVVATPLEMFRQTLTQGYPPVPKQFTEANHRVIIAVDQKSHMFLEELADAIKTETEAGRFQGKRPHILRLSDALATYLQREKLSNVWLQSSPALSAEADLMQRLRKAGSYPRQLDKNAEAQLHHLVCGAVACAGLQQATLEQMNEKVQTFQYAFHCLAKDINVIVYESWARPLFSRWDQARLPMIMLDATRIYMQEAIAAAIKDPPPEAD